MKAALIVLLVAVVALTQGSPAQHGIAFIEDMRNMPGARIIDGKPAENGQFPHQAYLVISTIFGSSLCGGSLIGSTWVMTAAHCISSGSNSVLVHLGDVRSSSSPVQIRSSKLIPHPNYNTNNLNNDIGLIELPSEVQETENIKAIALAKDPSKTYDGEIATVSGFGRTTNSGPVSPVLMHVNVRVISNDLCAQTYGGNVIISSTICVLGAENSSQGTCNGDSGGPLILQENGVTTMIGVVSFGSTAGCSSAHPNGFVRPSHFVDWINQQTGL